MRIVAVSNATSVLAHKLGPMIDAFDQVVRFNSATLSEQYAPHVGTKTTLWACSDWPPELYAGNRSRFADCRRLFVVPEIPGKEHVQTPQDAEAIPPSFERRLREQVRPRAGTWCTTGLITLAWLLREFEIVHTIGWFQPSVVRDEQAFLQHYDTPVADNLCCHHDVRAEAKFFRQWVALRRIVELETNPADCQANL